MFSEINKDLALDSFKAELDAALPANDTPYRKRLLVIVTDEEWDGKELAKSRWFFFTRIPIFCLLFIAFREFKNDSFIFPD